ncbi:protein phosphatase 2C domain-containing protein [Rhodobacteraceae bacterium]|nr:protein phosphatase 2C domain-containing protein [Paracoccaceae bacterium]
MMWRLPEPRFDIASALDRGGRDYQEDSLVSDFAVGDDCGIVVLADGMGGHSAGDVASKIVVTEIFSELKFHSDLFFDHAESLPKLMLSAINSANECVRDAIEDNPESLGMGSTVVATVIAGNKMYWSSVGDSPLYHYRAGQMKQVNEDHSMAPQIAAMVAIGAIRPEDAKTHPDRNSLTSAVCGGKIAKLDNRGVGLELKTGDIIVVSSDGLQFLEDKAIAKIITRNRRKPSADIANALLQAVKGLDDPEQDNISFSVIKVRHEKPVIRPQRRGNVTEIDFHSTRLLENSEVQDVETPDVKDDSQKEVEQEIARGVVGG